MYTNTAGFTLADGDHNEEFVIGPDTTVDVNISKAYLKDVTDSNHKVPHYMVVSEAIGTGNVGVAHFRYGIVLIYLLIAVEC